MMMTTRARVSRSSMKRSCVTGAGSPAITFRLFVERRSVRLAKLSESQKRSLNEAVSRYHKGLRGSPAEEYLARRGLPDSVIDSHRLGFVEDPLPEHEHLRGRLAIPYLRKHPSLGWTTVSIRFRALDDSKPKYKSLSGDRPRLYNANVLTLDTPDVGIAEGEIDALSATFAGLPTVGVPGANAWQSHFAPLFAGYRTVYLFTDGDEAGEKLAASVTKELGNVKVIPFPEGEDVNSVLVSQGVEQLQRLWQ